MPEMLGPELARRILTDNPAMRVLFMSGYFHQVIAHLEQSDEAFEFIEKPFTADALLRAVRNILDRQADEPAATRG